MNPLTTERTKIMSDHDDKCELRPGGAYDGLSLGGRPIPCHCSARKAGRIKAEREMRDLQDEIASRHGGISMGTEADRS